MKTKTYYRWRVRISAFAWKPNGNLGNETLWFCKRHMHGTDWIKEAKKAKKFRTLEEAEQLVIGLTLDDEYKGWKVIVDKLKFKMAI